MTDFVQTPGREQVHSIDQKWKQNYPSRNTSFPSTPSPFDAPASNRKSPLRLKLSQAFVQTLQRRRRNGGPERDRMENQVALPLWCCWQPCRRISSPPTLRQCRDRARTRTLGCGNGPRESWSGPGCLQHAFVTTRTQYGPDGCVRPYEALAHRVMGRHDDQVAGPPFRGTVLRPAVRLLISPPSAAQPDRE